MYHVWEELGAVQDRRFLYADDFLRYESVNGEVFTLHCNLEKLEQHMLEVSPEDSEATHRFCKAAREFAAIPGLESQVDERDPS